MEKSNNNINILNPLKRFSLGSQSREDLDFLVRQSIRLCYSQVLSINDIDNSCVFDKDEYYNITMRVISNLFTPNLSESNILEQLNKLSFELEDESDAHYFLHRIINIELKQLASKKYENISMLA